VSLYVYKSASGSVVEASFPIGKAPKSLRRGGVIHKRVYTMPVVRQLTPLDRGDRPCVSHQLPQYYGYGQRETCWKERMQQLGIEDTPHRRMQVTKANMGPKPQEILRRTKEAAAKAGALDHFDKKGRPMARTKRGIGRHLETAKRIGDTLGWD
jgi:hypothetical protein